MARKRFITSEISTDRKIAKLAEKNPTAAALWPWFITAYFNTSHVKVRLFTDNKPRNRCSDFNTSHVKVRLVRAHMMSPSKGNFNTSHVKVRLSVRLFGPIVKLDFNTSHVKVRQLRRLQ